MADEGDEPFHGLDAAVEIADDAIESGALELRDGRALRSRRADEHDRTVLREQCLRPAREAAGEVDVRAADQVPAREFRRGSSVDDLGTPAPSPDHGTRPPGA